MDTSIGRPAPTYTQDRARRAAALASAERPTPRRDARAAYWVGAAGLALFELANVWLVMPLPGSQRMRSVDVAYFLYTWRWAFRLAFGALLLAGAPSAWRRSRRAPARWSAAIALLAVAGVAYVANVVMAADHMFVPPRTLAMQPASRNAVDPRRLVVGVEIGGEARAYPVQFIGYHHQVRDTVGGVPVLVTYCTVCRTGRVFDPRVNGRPETFRLVGMDHWNAMFEDATTRSWWRQATGEAVAGPRRGAALAELPSAQLPLGRWLALHPASLVMQPDAALQDEYTKTFDYETGKSRKALTGTDTASWRDKSWVVGIAIGGASTAYDWRRLVRERAIDDVVGGRPLVLLLASDSTSFFAYERPDAATTFSARGDSLVASTGAVYGLDGRGPAGTLAPVRASQEFWHSWRTFHPDTRRY